MRRVLVIGFFGYQTNRLDGQTVKTRDLYRLICEQDETSVDFYDTEEFQYHKLSILKMFWKILCCKILIYLPGQNNLRRIFPLIYCLSMVRKIQIQYFVVGGWLQDFLDNNPLHRFMLSRIKGIYVETKQLRNKLENISNLKNVDLFPNFRFFHSDLSNVHQFDEGVLKIVFVSRVEKSKGLDTLLEVSKIIRELNLAKKISIDFYGNKVDSYFDEHLNKINFFKYKGILQPCDVISTLKTYDLLIFPTHYEGEGCPGILIEAMAAGLPIIASDWKYNAEFVDSGENGILCDTYDAQSYINAINLFLNDTALLKKMSIRAVQYSKLFTDLAAKEKLSSILKTE